MSPVAPSGGPPPGLPALTVVVLNYRDAAATLRCVDSVLSSDYAGALRLLVVDNGSADGSRERLEAFAARAGGSADPAAGVEPAGSGTGRPVRVVASPRNLGFAGGVNLAWTQVETEFVCLLNNDAALHPDCPRRLAVTLRDRSDLGAVWPYDAPMSWHASRRVPDPADVARLRNGTSSVTGTNIWLPLLRDYRECFTPSGVCLMVRRAQIERPFPGEYFAYYEDVYLGWRLRLRGLGVERVPEAVVYHEGSAASRHDAALRPVLAFHAEKNRLANLLIFYERRTLLRLAPLLLLDEAKRCAGALARLRPPAVARALGTLARARWWLLRRRRWIAEERRAVQAGRVAPDRDILPLMSGRLTPGQGPTGRTLNVLSLGYCRLAGLLVVELSGQSRSPMP